MASPVFLWRGSITDNHSLRSVDVGVEYHGDGIMVRVLDAASRSDGYPPAVSLWVSGGQVRALVFHESEGGGALVSVGLEGTGTDAHPEYVRVEMDADGGLPVYVGPLPASHPDKWDANA